MPVFVSDDPAGGINNEEYRFIPRYQNFPSAFYSVTMWLLGDFDRDELRNTAALGFMLFSLLITVLIMLNLVIAVRSLLTTALHVAYNCTARSHHPEKASPHFALSRAAVCTPKRLPTHTLTHSPTHTLTHALSSPLYSFGHDMCARTDYG